MKGFTLIEFIIMLALFFILIVPVVVFLSGKELPGPSSGKNGCDFYKNWAMKDVPAGCIKYFYQGGE